MRVSLFSLAIWLLTLPYYHANIVPAGSLQEDRDSLCSLFKSFNNKAPLKSWSCDSNNNASTPSPCIGWLGVSCTGDRVTKLSLEKFSMGGTIPDSLFGALALTYLSLNTLGLSGKLSCSLSRLNRTLSTLILYKNSLSGSIPTSCLGTLSALSVLDVGTNQFGGDANLEFLCNCRELTTLSLGSQFPGLTGTLPACISNWRVMTSLSIWNNSFQGTLPDLRGLEKLTTIFADNNHFSGSLPQSLSTITTLSVVNLYNNDFTGELPDLGNCALSRLSVYRNSLSGTFPSWIGKLKNLKSLELHENRFWGTIPTEVGLLTNLVLFRLGYNAFSGPLPPSLCNATSLMVFNATNNKLTSTLPGCISRLSKLQYLNLKSNDLTGQLTGTLLPRSLSTFVGSSNRFSGPLPVLNNLPMLVLLQLSNNLLSVLSPTQPIAVPQLKFLYLNNNRLRGRIDELLSKQLCALVRIQQLSLANNELSGTISSCLASLAFAKTIDLSSNSIQGTLPPLASLKSIQTLKLSYNSLTGSIGASDLPDSLVLLAMDHNRFSGQISFVRQTMRALETLDLSFNGFTGPVGGVAINAVSDSSVFALPLLRNFAASSNCFQNSPLPNNLCQATSLQTLIMNGITSGDACKKHYFPQPNAFSLTGTYAARIVEGDLPLCLFRGMNLTTLHISGVGLKGKLPDDGLPWPNRLRELSLSHNQISGSLSSTLQRSLGSLNNLDLSFNKLGGTLVEAELPSSSLSLHVNRFSGILSSAVISSTSTRASPGSDGPSTVAVQILESNLFDCVNNPQTGNNELPLSDPFLLRFQCGSMALNRWLIAVASMLVGTGLLVWVTREAKKFRKKQSSVAPARGGPTEVESNVDERGNGGEANNPAPASSSSCQDPDRPDETPLSLFVFAEDLVLRALGVGFDGDSHNHEEHMRDRYTTTTNSLHSQVRPLSIASQQDCPVGTQIDGDNKSQAAFWLLGKLLSRTRVVSSAIAALSLVFLIPLYGLLAATNGTHAFEYAWDVSAALKSGPEAAATLLVVWTLVLVAGKLLLTTLFLSIKLRRPKDGVHENRDDESIIVEMRESEVGPGPLSIAMKAVLVARLLAIAAVNIVLVMIANVLFVQHNESGTVAEQGAVKVFFSVSKFIWNTSMISWLVKNPYLHYGLSRSQVERSGGWLRGGDMFQLALLVFNNIVAPCIATAFTDRRCFQQVLFAAPALQTSYAEQQSVVAGIRYNDYRVGSGFYLPNTTSPISVMASVTTLQISSFSSPFVYRFQCSSSLLQTYVPIFVLLGAFTIFGTPVKWAALRALIRACFVPSPRDSNPPKALHQMHRALLSALPRLLWTEQEKRLHPFTSTQPIDLEKFHLETLSDLVVCLTFGLAAPLLNLVLMLSMSARAWRLEFLLKQRLPADPVSEAREVSTYLRAGSAMYTTSTFNLLFPALFLALFLVDAASDRDGLRAGSWAPVLMLILPATTALVIRLAVPAQRRLAIQRAVTEVALRANSFGIRASLASIAVTFGGSRSRSRGDRTPEGAAHKSRWGSDGELEVIDVIPRKQSVIQSQQNPMLATPSRKGTSQGPAAEGAEKDGAGPGPGAGPGAGSGAGVGVGEE